MAGIALRPASAGPLSPAFRESQVGDGGTGTVFYSVFTRLLCLATHNLIVSLLLTAIRYQAQQTDKDIYFLSPRGAPIPLLAAQVQVQVRVLCFVYLLILRSTVMSFTWWWWEFLTATLLCRRLWGETFFTQLRFYVLIWSNANLPFHFLIELVSLSLFNSAVLVLRSWYLRVKVRYRVWIF